jgi:hypothetical protein
MPWLLGSPAYLRTRDFIRSRWFEYIIDAVVLVNAILAVIQVCGVS